MKGLLRVEVAGVHSEVYGAGNQEWDARVRAAVEAALASQRPDRALWYEVEASWFVVLGRRRDIDNFWLKPVLDVITESEYLWPDDTVDYVRRVDSRVEGVEEEGEERLVVIVSGK